MNAGVIFLVGGVIVWLASYFFRDLFVDTADEKNPYRMLNSAIGYLGLIGAAWGVVILLLAR